MRILVVPLCLKGNSHRFWAKSVRQKLTFVHLMDFNIDIFLTKGWSFCFFYMFILTKPTRFSKIPTSANDRFPAVEITVSVDEETGKSVFIDRDNLACLYRVLASANIAMTNTKSGILTPFHRIWSWNWDTCFLTVVFQNDYLQLLLASFFFVVAWNIEHVSKVQLKVRKMARGSGEPTKFFVLAGPACTPFQNTRGSPAVIRSVGTNKARCRK